MTRVHVIAEGQTEEEFVNLVLVPHFADMGIFLDVRCVPTGRRRSKLFRGGLLDYGQAKGDILRWMKEDDHPDCFFTTMFDLYHLPSDFPGFEAAKRSGDSYRRVEMLEMAMKTDIGHVRFIPYVQLHEFEALILAGPEQLAYEFVDRRQEIQLLVEICSKFSSPELIDDGSETSPSKRIISQIPEYKGKKVSVGPRIAAAIGLNILKEKCRHFSEWLERIGSLQVLE